MHEGYHIGRSWTGHQIEDECPCRQAECGLVEGDHVTATECPQHSIYAAKTIRQMHRASKCPGAL